jgi:hypothetical protein
LFGKSLRSGGEERGRLDRFPPETTLCVSFGTEEALMRPTWAGEARRGERPQLPISTRVYESKAGYFPYMKLEGRRGS